MGDVRTEQVTRQPDISTLREFLLARIEEDEALVLAFADFPGSQWPDPVPQHVAERALDACAARRRMVVEHSSEADHPEGCITIRLFAAAYLGHPGFPEEWQF